MLHLALVFIAQTGVLYEKQSLFSHIQVRDTARGRELMFDTITQSAMRPGKPKELLLDYTQTSMLALCFAEPKHVLVIGLGGASMPNFLLAHYPTANIDSVEIDPVVVELARKYFDYREWPNNRVFVQDGAEYVAKTKRKYDIIFLDAYAPDFIPAGLANRAFFALARTRLKPGGVLVSNVWGPPSPRYDPMRTEQQAVFNDLYVVRARTSGNHIFIASPTPRALTKTDLLACADKLDFDFDLKSIVQNGWLAR